MDIYVLDRSLSVVGICDDYKSVIWTPRYSAVGDFELYMPATAENIDLMQEDRYVVRDKDMEADDCYNVMIIRCVQITTSVEDGNYLTVSGQCLKSLLSRRIVWQQTTLYGNLEKAVRSVVEENAIEPAIAARKIDRLVLGDLQGFTDTIDKQVTGAVLSDFVTEVCDARGLGWDIWIHGDNFVFSLKKGTDRSYRQTSVPPVVFSNEFDNLLTTDYTYDKSNYKNIAVVAGEGEGLDRKRAVVGAASGLDRYELYVDSRNSSSNDGEITQNEYVRILEEEGKKALAEDKNAITEIIEGTVEPLSNYIFNTDYFLGDIVEVINEYGIEMTPRIIEIIESEDESGSSTIPTFSS